MTEAEYCNRKISMRDYLSDIELRAAQVDGSDQEIREGLLAIAKDIVEMCELALKNK